MTKNRIALILSMLALPVTLLGQSTLNFPRAYTPADLTTTGFAVVNPGPTDASVTFRLLSPKRRIVSSSSQVVRARGQIARLGSEYFQNARQPDGCKPRARPSAFKASGSAETFPPTRMAQTAPSCERIRSCRWWPDRRKSTSQTRATRQLPVTIRLRGAMGVGFVGPS